MINTANGARIRAEDQDMPVLLEAIDTDTVRADVKTLLAGVDVLSELQQEIDYFTANPEVGSPAPDRH